MHLIETNGASAELYQELGKSYVQMRLYDDALHCFKKSLEFTPDDEWTYLYIGNVYFRRHAYSESIEWFKRSADCSVEPVVAFWCLGDAYKRLDDTESAEAYYLKAVKANPKSNEAQKRLDRFYSEYPHRRGTR